MMDVRELEEFARKAEAAAQDIKPYAAKTLEQIGDEFLKMVQSNIQAAGNVDFGKLLGSFSKGGNGNIFRLDTGSLTLTIGTSIYYAKWVNKGHKQQPGRFVPGVWEGKHFRYIPGAKTGMVLKASFVKGSHFFDKAEENIDRTMQEYVERAFRQFWSRYFG